MRDIFVINMDNGSTLGFAGDDNVKYADVVIGGEGITMIGRLTGRKRAQNETPFLIFINRSRNYPVRNLPDDVPGAAREHPPKGLLTVRLLWNTLKRNGVAIVRLGDNRPRTILLDNGLGHNTSVELTNVLSGLVRV